MLSRLRYFTVLLIAASCFGSSQPAFPELVRSSSLIAVVEMQGAGRWLASAKTLIVLKGGEPTSSIEFGGFNDPYDLGSAKVQPEVRKRYLVFLKWRSDLTRTRMAPKELMVQLREGTVSAAEVEEQITVQTYSGYGVPALGVGIYPIEGRNVRMRWYDPADVSTGGIPLSLASLLVRSLDIRPTGDAPKKTAARIRSGLDTAKVKAQVANPTPENIVELEWLLCARAHYHVRNVERGVIAASTAAARDVRRAAARALHDMPESEAILTAMARLLQDPDSGVQAEAAGAILQNGTTAELLRRAVIKALPTSRLAYRGDDIPYNPALNHTPSGREMLIRLVKQMGLQREAENVLAAMIVPDQLNAGIHIALRNHFKDAPSAKAIEAYAAAFAAADQQDLKSYAGYMLSEANKDLRPQYFAAIKNDELADETRYDLLREAVGLLSMSDDDVNQTITSLFKPADATSLLNRYVASLLIHRHAPEDRARLMTYLKQRKLPTEIYAELIGQSIYAAAYDVSFLSNVLGIALKFHTGQPLKAVAGALVADADVLRFEIHAYSQQLSSREQEKIERLEMYKKILDLTKKPKAQNNKVEHWSSVLEAMREPTSRHAEGVLWLTMMRHLDPAETPALIKKANDLLRNVRTSRLVPGCALAALDAPLSDVTAATLKSELQRWHAATPEGVAAITLLDAMRRDVAARKLAK